jgi:hypothetical protein
MTQSGKRDRPAVGRCDARGHMSDLSHLDVKTYDELVDSLGADGKVPRERKLAEDALAAVGELTQRLREQDKALYCYLHHNRRPTICPVCALVYVRTRCRNLRNPVLAS